MSELSNALDFDHVMQVNEDGSFHSAPQGLHAPEAYEPSPYATELDGWELPLSGFTGQDRYTGPWLHASEVIEGGVETYIREHPGFWVAIYSSYGCEECGGAGLVWNAEMTEELPCPAECEPGETTIEGWTMAFKPFS